MKREPLGLDGLAGTQHCGDFGLHRRIRARNDLTDTIASHRTPPLSSYPTFVSSRQRPSAFCAARSDALKRTASSLASCDTGCHDGTTKISRGPHSKVCDPTRLRPRPSTTW